MENKTREDRWSELANNLGHRSFLEGNYAVAKRVYEGHAKHNFNHPVYAQITSGDQRGFYADILGHCYERLGETEKAIQSYQSAAKYYKDNGSRIVAPELFEKARNLEMKLTSTERRFERKWNL